MKKRISQIVRSGFAVLLSVAMIAGSVAIPAKAEEANDTVSYVAIGDSMTNGYGMEGYYPLETGKFYTSSELNKVNVYGYKRNVEAAYPSIVADAMGWDLTNLAISGMRPEELHVILNEDYEGDAYTKAVFIESPDTEYRFCDAVGHTHNNDGCTEAVDGLTEIRAQYEAAIKGADVISVNMGTNNFGTVVTNRIIKMLEGGEYHDVAVEQLIKDEKVKEQYLALKALAMEELQAEMGAASYLVERMADILAYGFLGFVQNYDASLNLIRDLNPEAKLVVMGLNNALDGMILDVEVEGEKVSVDAGDIFAVLVDWANLYMAAFEGDGLDAIFVNVEDLDLMVDALGRNEVNKTFESKLVGYIAGFAGVPEAQIIGALNYNMTDALAPYYQVKGLLAAAAANGNISAASLTAVMEKGLDAILANPTSPEAQGLLHVYVRFMVAEGIGIHPSEKGHQQMADAFIEAYNNNYTGKDFAEEEIKNALKDIYALLEEYGPVIAEDAYKYAEENGYIEQLENAIKELKAEVQAYAEDARLQIENAIGELEAELKALEAKLESLKAELESLKAELENANAELQAEIQAAIEAIEAKIAEVKATIEAIEAKIAEVKEAIAELQAKLAEIDAKAKELIAAIEGLEEALKELVDVASGKLEGEVNNAIDKIQAALDKVADAIETVEDFVDAFNTAIDEAQAFVEKVNAAVVALKEEVANKVAEIKATIEKVKEELETLVNDIIADVENVVENIENVIANIENAVANIENVVAGLEATIEESLEAAVAKLQETVEAALAGLDNAIKAKLDEVKAAFNAAYIGATTGDYTVSADSYYVSMGDSTVTGFGLPGYDNYGYQVKVKKAFGYKLAQELGLNTETQYVQLGQGGLRAEDLRYILDANYTPDEYTLKRTVEELNTFGGGLDNYRATFKSEIEKADLITIGFGNNNFTTFVTAQIERLTSGEALYAMDWNALLGAEAAAQVPVLLNTVNNYFLESGVDAQSAAMLTKLVECYAYGYVGFAFNYTEVLNAIHAINPEAKVIVVGAYNPIDDLVIEMEGGVVEFGQYVNYFIELTNLHFTAYAMLTPNTVFVEAPAVETFLDADIAAGEYEEVTLMTYLTAMMAESGKAMHANANGHEYIKNQILGALNITVEETGLIGDVNDDGSVDIFDVQTLFDHVMEVPGKVITDAKLLARADVNGDGSVDIFDVQTLFDMVMNA